MHTRPHHHATDGHAPRRRFGAGPSHAQPLAAAFARSARDDNCRDVVVLDVRGLSQVTDYLVIATGTSDRQMATVIDHIEQIAHAHGVEAFHIDRDAPASWVLADFIDVVVHVFEPSARAHYDLEMLWGDAPRVPWDRPDQR